MYIKVKDRKLFKELDEHLTLPKRFNDYVKKIYSTHNFIIKEKGKNIYFCTNCKTKFEEEKKLKINNYIKCPNCHQNLKIKSCRIKYFTFEDEFVILDEYLDMWILRYFHIEGNYKNKNTKNFICEYARKIYKKDNFFKALTTVNNHFYRYISGWGFDYCVDNLEWRYLNEYSYFRLNTSVKLFPYNLKKLFKNTRYQYSQLWILAKKIEGLEIIHLLNYYNQSVELLIKLKLYNLAQNPLTFKKNGNFIERFGIDKSYLPFMQKYDITISELNVLKFTKKRNINLLRLFAGEDLSEYKKFNVNLEKLVELTDFNKNHKSEYDDYLNFANELGYDLTDKKILYPSNILEEHDRLAALIEIKKNKLIQKNIKKRYDELKDNIFKTKKYIIFPAKSVTDFVEESRQQNNCVKTYMEKYSKKSCDIYFMRLTTNPKKSVVTIEVKNDKVVQQRTKNNMDTTKEQKKVIELFEKNLKGDKTI